MGQNYKNTSADIPFTIFDTIVIGSGCAALNAADCLFDLGRKNIAIVTEGINMGTSRNAGSDKQTYYKLNLAGKTADSVYRMARDLFWGGAVDGDHALVEAANSVKAFMKLVFLGVPFPMNEFGEYTGYQTDHDLLGRATSAGPLTSKYMTECLERAVKRKGITLLDHMLVFEIVADTAGVMGILCIDLTKCEEGRTGILGIYAKNVIVATGGPAGCYKDRVYPPGHTGMSGMLFEAGVRGANLNCWQYGLASTKFRWNVSGTYQQALPRYISVDDNGREYEFLEDDYKNPYEAADMIFLKGYQWPFDKDRLDGSSRIDMLVYRQTIGLGRRVYMDFRKNPRGVRPDFSGLSRETADYLKKSHALLDTPIARLERMNPLAVQLYKKHGIDLFEEPLEVRVCAQHHNGGAEVDINYETCIPGLYVAGEAAGIYGAKRPGGSALNSCQVSAMRAAEHIAYETLEDRCVTRRQREAMGQGVEKWLCRIHNSTRMKTRPQLLEQRDYFAGKMSACAALVRDYEKMEQLYAELRVYLTETSDRMQGASFKDLPIEIKNRDIAITQRLVLSSMLMETKNVDGTKRIISSYDGGDCKSFLRPVRNIPEGEAWFETVWNSYRERVKAQPEKECEK